MSSRNKIITISIVLMLIIIASFFINKYKYFIGLYFSDPSNYRNYRLSDMITANDSIRNNPMGVKYHLKYYPDSIIAKYYSKQNEPNNISLLYDIVKNYKLENYPLENTIILHLRVGEVLENSNFSVNEHLKDELLYTVVSYKNYVKPYSYYQKIIDNNKEKLPTKVEIKAGGCFYDDKSKSIEYIKKIKEFFEKNNFKVEYDREKSDNPDIDFVYMSHAKHFIKSGGGFSSLVEKMVNKNGGKSYV
jgi:hypothetical protein